MKKAIEKIWRCIAKAGLGRNNRSGCMAGCKIESTRRQHIWIHTSIYVFILSCDLGNLQDKDTAQNLYCETQQ